MLFQLEKFKMISGIISKEDGSKGNFSFKYWNSLRNMSDKEKEFIKEISLFYPLKKLDCEIRTFRKEQNEDKTFYWVCEVGFCESLGELGFIYPFYYDEFPLLSEIKESIINEIIDEKEELNNNLLSYSQEKHLEALNKIKL